MADLSQQVANQLVAEAVSHMHAQNRDVAAVQHELQQVWRSVLDPDDLAASFQRFAIVAQSMIHDAQTAAIATADSYYLQTRVTAGLPAQLPATPPVFGSIAADLAALYSTGFVAIQRALKDGATVQQAASSATAAMLGGAQRRILDAPRQRLINLSQADSETVGWARVGDGDPCYFCAMLIGRGPVYSAESVHFSAHDHDGCTARPVFASDPSGGWDSQADALRHAWYGAEPDEPIDPKASNTLRDWRRQYEKARQDPTSALSRALAGPRTAYAPAA